MSSAEQEHESPLPIEAENMSLDVRVVWHLVEAVVQERQAFATDDGLVGRNLLDYPGGFRFAPPRGVTEKSWHSHHMDAPVYTVWSHAGPGTYTVAWYSETSGWVFPELREHAPVEVRQHQWLMRVLTSHPLPGVSL